MSQTTIIIWSVALVLLTAAAIAVLAGIAHHLTRSAKAIELKRSNLDAREKEIGKRIAFVTSERTRLEKEAAEAFKQSKLERDPESRIVYSYVVYTPEELLSIQNLQSVTRKKLAQRLGYKILELYHGSIREVQDDKGRAFRIDFWIKPKR